MKTFLALAFTTLRTAAVLLGQRGNAGVGDINSDGVVNAADVTMLLGAWQ